MMLGSAETEDPRLISREVFEVSQQRWSQYLNVTEGWMDSNLPWQYRSLRSTRAVKMIVLSKYFDTIISALAT